MKSGIKLMFFGLLLLLGVSGVFASICKDSNGYYEECYNIYSYDRDYNDYYYRDHVNVYEGDYCYDNRGYSYYCHKEYYYSCDKNDSGCYKNRDYDNDYFRHYISINYRDVYGNYVREERPDYSRTYYYDNYYLTYNNPYYPDYYIYDNLKKINLESKPSRDLLIYIN